MDIKPRVLTTAIDLDNATASLDLALQVATYFELTPEEAKAIVYEVGTAVNKWRTVASHLKLTGAQIKRMASAFEHADLKKAVSGIAFPAY